MLTLKLVFASYLVVNILLSISIFKKKIIVNQVPMSVYERAVTWHQDIMNMADADKKMYEFKRWNKFVEDIPRRQSKFTANVTDLNDT